MMLLSIKLNDKVVVKKSANQKFWLSRNYFEANEMIQKNYGLKDENCFEVFQKEIFDNFEIIDSPYNLYYLANAKKIAKTYVSHIINKVNYLNYFGFKLAKPPTVEQINLLNKLQDNSIIEFYWFEGETLKKNVVETPTDNENINPKSNYYADELNFKDIKKRGAGTKIIAFEDLASDDIMVLAKQNKFLSHFTNRSSTVSRLGGKNIANENITHQTHTLVTLFAQKPPDVTPETFEIIGLVPDAELIVCSIQPVQNNDNLGMIRRNLSELNASNKKNCILLFEFETDIFDESIPPQSIDVYPVIIYKDIAQQLTDLVKNKNFIIVAGAGNGGIDFDNIKNPPWKMQHQTYNDLSQNHQSLIMIGATTKKNGVFVKSPFNVSDNLDAYLYTSFVVEDNPKVSYGGTSGAAAVAAGIITFLQGKALKTGEILTNAIIKAVFKATFMKNYPEIILTQTTLEQLWEACQKELESQ